MTMPTQRLVLLALMVGGIALAGCSNTPSKAQTTGTSGTRTSSAASSGATRTKAPATPAANTQALPSSTGIPSCDDYLASYVACHRTAAIYAPDQIPTHYQEMRTSLLRDSQDPAIRPQLGARCASLAQQLKEALHGKSCGPVSPASAGSR